jgi:hypothetical protein
VLEKVFGDYIINSDEKKVCVRDLGEEHVVEDLGTIPTVEQWLRNMPIEPWMFSAKHRPIKKTRRIDFNKKVD